MAKSITNRTIGTGTGAIILAAGDSTRMGRCKYLLPMGDGSTFFEHIVHTFSDYGINEIVVVTQATNVDVLNDLCAGMETVPTFVINRFPERERFYSLQLGLSALGNIDFTFIHNADEPFIDFATLGSLSLNRNKADYICPVFNNKGGHPILLNKTAMRYILSCNLDAVLNEVLKKLRRFNVPVNNELVTVDIDTPKEYQHYFVNNGAKYF